MPTSPRYQQTVDRSYSSERSAKLARILGENVRKHREAAQLDMQDVAAALQLDTADYKIREQGTQRFTSGELVALCELLGVLPSIFLRDFV